MFRHEMTTAGINTFENNLAAGEGWLVVYDLITWAIDTHHEVPVEYLQVALAAAERRAYGRLTEPFRARLLAELRRMDEADPWGGKKPGSVNQK